MSFFLGTALSYLLVYKYYALFVITFFAAIALPLPSAPSLMAAAAFSNQGYFNIVLVIITASAANIAGDNTAYWLARLYGKPVFYKIGLRKFLESPLVKILEAEINEYRGPVVLISRAQVQATMIVNIIAGLSRMSYLHFFLYSAVGEIIQVLVYAGLGYFFGSNWQAIYDIFGKFALVLVLVGALLLIFVSRNVTRKVMRRLKVKHGQGRSGSD